MGGCRPNRGGQRGSGRQWRCMYIYVNGGTQNEKEEGPRGLAPEESLSVCPPQRRPAVQLGHEGLLILVLVINVVVVFTVGVSNDRCLLGLLEPPLPQGGARDMSPRARWIRGRPADTPGTSVPLKRPGILPHLETGDPARPKSPGVLARAEQPTGGDVRPCAPPSEPSP